MNGNRSNYKGYFQEKRFIADKRTRRTLQLLNNFVTFLELLLALSLPRERRDRLMMMELIMTQLKTYKNPNHLQIMTGKPLYN